MVSEVNAISEELNKHKYVIIHLTTIPQAHVGYEMIDSTKLALIIPYRTSMSGIINS